MTTVYAIPAAAPPADSVYGDHRRRQGLLAAAGPSTHPRASSAASNSPRAPSATPSHRSASPTSVHTDPENVNPYAAFANTAIPPEVHVVKVTEDSVVVESGPPREGILSKVGLTLSKLPGIASDADLPISPPGPPPPSPPASRAPSPAPRHSEGDTPATHESPAPAPIARNHAAEALAQPHSTPAPLQALNDPMPAPNFSSPAPFGTPGFFDSPLQTPSPIPMHYARVPEGNFVPPHRKQQQRAPEAAAVPAPAPMKMQPSRSEGGAVGVTFEEPPAEGSRHPSRFQSSSAPSAGPSPLLLRSSTDSRTTQQSGSPQTGTSRLRSSTTDEFMFDEHARGTVSADNGLLHPPAHAFRPTRRNTTGSNALLGAKTIHGARVGGGALSEEPDSEPGLTLASDIELQAEQIRRERQSKREKAQRAAEAKLTRSGSKSTMDENRPLVGNLIGEGHVNYVMMYNMLTGIRIAVSTLNLLMTGIKR